MKPKSHPKHAELVKAPEEFLIMEKFDELQKRLRDLEIEEEFINSPQQRPHTSYYNYNRNSNPEVSVPRKEKSNERQKSRNRTRSRSSGGNETASQINFNKPQKDMLMEVFDHYSYLGDRMNSLGLGLGKIQRFMTDAGVYDENIDSVRVDLLFASISRSKKVLNSEAFLKLIDRIAEFKFPGAHTPIEPFMKDHIYPILRNIRINTNLPERKTIMRDPIDPCSTRILFEVQSNLLRIYSAYFTWENSSVVGNQRKERSKQSIIKFCAEFEICPNLFSKGTIIWLFEEICQKQPLSSAFADRHTFSKIQAKECGELFTFVRFCIFLCKASSLAYQRSDVIEKKELPLSFAAEKLLRLLGKMELSEGFLNLELKTNTTHTTSTSYFKLDKIRKAVCSIKKCQNQSEILSKSPARNCQRTLTSPGSGRQAKRGLVSVKGQSSRSPCLKYISTTVPSPGRYSHSSKVTQSMNSGRHTSPMRVTSSRIGCTNKENKEEQREMLELYRGQLRKIFEGYSAFGEPTNRKSLKWAKFHKMMNDCGLLLKGETSVKTLNTSKPKGPGFNIEDVPRKISPIDLDLVLSASNSKVTAKNNTECLGHHNKMMTFETFMLSLKGVASVLYPDYDLTEALEYILERRIIPLLDSGDFNDVYDFTRYEYLVSCLRNKEMIDLLLETELRFQMIFNHYSINRSTIDMRSFTNFCQDFDILPRYVSIGRVQNVFEFLAFAYRKMGPFKKGLQLNKKLDDILACLIKLSEKGEEESLGSSGEINRELFCVALALIGKELIPDSNVNPTDKFITVLQIMSQSEGLAIIKKACGYASNPKNFSWDGFSTLIRDKCVY